MDDTKFDTASEIKAFDETKAGVKGIVDAGITTIPRIFIHQQNNNISLKSTATIPTIDLGEDDKSRVVDQIRTACEKWGFFQVVNHGIPIPLLDSIRDSIRNFHEQDHSIKKLYNTRVGKKVMYNSNFDLLTRNGPVDWRDTLACVMHPEPPGDEELPEVVREVMGKYAEEVLSLGRKLFGLLSEALGLSPEKLEGLGCADGMFVLGHYYPVCPQPELTYGVPKHSDNDFMTVMLQDKGIGGLQILCDGEWFDVPPIDEALVVNIGDLLQLISNDKFKSAELRVLTNSERARVSLATFFNTRFLQDKRIYGPIKELLSKDNPAVYRDTTVMEYAVSYMKKELDESSALLDYLIEF